MSPSELDHPGAVPEKSESEIPNDPSFVAACMADIADHVDKFGLHFGNSILTRHPHWGLVWRVDILTDHESGRTPRIFAGVRRIWRTASVAQHIFT
jgi:hypothetical protein